MDKLVQVIGEGGAGYWEGDRRYWRRGAGYWEGDMRFWRRGCRLLGRGYASLEKGVYLSLGEILWITYRGITNCLKKITQTR